MTMMKNQNEIKKEINNMSDRISNCVTVTIRPAKDGVKITSHKEQVVKLKY